MPKSLQQMEHFMVLELKSFVRSAIKPTDRNLSLVWQPVNGAHRCRLASEVNCVKSSVCVCFEMVLEMV